MKPIKLFYYFPRENFGDALNIALINKLGQRKVEFANPAKCEMVMIGSLLDSFVVENVTFKDSLKKIIKPQIIIFGTGFGMKSKVGQEKLLRKLKIIALRGEISKKRIEKITAKKFKNIALGDPGLLSSLLIERQEKKYAVGIVPHMFNKDDKNLALILRKIPQSIIIDIEGDPIEFLKKLDSCETILSNAMHGLIAADSLHIPNMRLHLQKPLIGGDYKFNDYYSVYDNTPIGASVHELLADNSNIKEYITKNYNLSFNQIDSIKENLLNHLPNILKQC